MNTVLPPLHVSAGVIPVTAAGAGSSILDRVAVEALLEIRLGHTSPSGYITTRLAITMRTPGADRELVAGFLLSEGIISGLADLAGMSGPAGAEANVIRADLATTIGFDPSREVRQFYVSSSCGVCGKSSLEGLADGRLLPLPREGLRVSAPVIHQLPETLRQAQPAFNATGGLHAAALYRADGTLLSLHEDVGRHNALDKLIGEQLLANRTPLEQRIVLVSGRVSFELVQKCITSGVPVLAAVGAPSSLAIELAQEYDLTLLGFVRDTRFNIYSGEWRIDHEATNPGKLDSAAPVAERSGAVA